MPEGQIDRALGALVAAADDPDRMRILLDHWARALLRRPALGGQLVARLCAAPETAAEVEAAAGLLSAWLETARQAREAGRSRGETALAEAGAALALAHRQGALTPGRRLRLARIWARSGVAPPVALELTADAAGPGAAPPADRAEAEAMIESLLSELLHEAGDDAALLHAALCHSFPAMPAALRQAVVRQIARGATPLFARLSCFWLLDADPALRRAAAEGLEARAAAGGLDAELAARLVVLRSWMPEDAARAVLDRLMRDAMRAGLGAAGAGPEAAWEVLSVHASLPDGGGAQSFCAALRSGRRRAAAMVLLKQGQGVKDAFVLSCGSAARQKSLLRQLADETGALPVPQDLLRRALAGGLAEGLAAGRPPPPGLIEVAALCGLADLRPATRGTEDILAGLAAAARVAALPAAAFGRLVGSSRQWWDRHDILQSWFEEHDDACALILGQPDPAAAEAALWAWLEGRRDWCAGIVARAAEVLDAAGAADADAFAAVARALAQGRPLRRIPVMEDVLGMTIAACLHEVAEAGPGPGAGDESP